MLTYIGIAHQNASIKKKGDITQHDND